MPPLNNPRRERFVQNRIKGMSQTEAYKAAGFESTNDNAVQACASRLEAEQEVRERMNELHERSARRAELKRADILTMLCETIEEARLNRQSSAAIRGIELLGKETNNMFAEKKDAKAGLGDDIGLGQLERIRAAIVSESTRRTQETDRKGHRGAEDRDVLSQYGIVKA